MAKSKKETVEVSDAQKIQAEKLKNLNAIANAINKKAGKIVIGKASDKEMIEILRKAIKAASYNTGCGGGCIIMNTDSNKIYDFEELKDLKFENSLKK